MSTTSTNETAHSHEIGIAGECPICAKLRDPETGALPFNDKVKAAIAEGEAMMRGEIPARWYKPHEFEEAMKDLLED